MTVKEKIQLFPHSPGVYRYYDAAGNVIYVGKAKDLHKRVAQYFVPPERLNTKTRVLVSKIADAQYSVVDSEADALLLENNLIKQYKPKYNILLKDSKTYPWICVSSDTYPRVYITRRVEKGAGRYFGPYSSALAARNLVDFFHHTYRLRTCKYKIDSQSILMRKYRPCLDYQIGRCSGPCIGAISQQDYLAGIEEIVNLLKGGANDIIQKYRQEMERASDALEFERAQQCKMMLDALQNHYSKSIISAARDMNLDVFSLVFEGFEAFGNFFRVRGGAIIQSLNLGFKMNIEEDRASVLSAFIAEIEAKFGELSAEVIVPFLPDVQIEGVNFKIPARGDKLSLLELSSKNAKEYQFNSMKQRERTNPDEFRQTVLEELRKALGMKELPVHMECFDNSNIQGTNPVASCVVFRDGEPSKKDYRKFKIKTVVGANDYASMKEVVNRRYSRMLAENPEDLPQLVVIDGGKGQLDFAYQALDPLFIDRNSQALKVLQRIRDEAHRFGITFHRSLRSKQQIHSALTEIKGVGEQTEKRLLMHFGSVARIAAASEQDIAALVGPALAARIKEVLSQ